MRTILTFLTLISFLVTGRQITNGRVLSVGRGKALSLPSEAAAIAKHGDTIEIDGGLYVGDVAVWTANSLTIRGVNGRPHLIASGKSAQEKAIWVVQGQNTTIENIEFSGAAVPDLNGAGIRQEGAGLTVRHCYFHDNQMGLLTGANPASDIVIQNSEFTNSFGGSISHNIYIGVVRSFTLQFSRSHHATVGHNVKSRAETNYILYNELMDEDMGRSSYSIDVPNGGRSYIIGNVIQQGKVPENAELVSYAAERATNRWQELFVINNTFINDYREGIFIHVYGRPSPAYIVNNLFVGAGTVLQGAGALSNNLVSNRPMFIDKEKFNYHLLSNSPAIDRGIQPGIGSGFDLTPVFEYVSPLAGTPRKSLGNIDIGAYEYGNN